MKTTIFSQISIDGKLTMGAGNSSKELFLYFPVRIWNLFIYSGEGAGNYGRQKYNFDGQSLSY